MGYSDLFVLSKKDMWDVLKEYPAARIRLEAIAVKRLEKYKRAPLEKGKHSLRFNFLILELRVILFKRRMKFLYFSTVCEQIFCNIFAPFFTWEKSSKDSPAPLGSGPRCPAFFPGGRTKGRPWVPISQSPAVALGSVATREWLVSRLLPARSLSYILGERDQPFWNTRHV